MPIYHVKSGERRAFDSGFVSGSIHVAEASGVRVFGVRTRDEQEVELSVGDAVSVSEIHADYLWVQPAGAKVGELRLQNLDARRRVIAEAHHVVASFPVLLDCDADRNGAVSQNELGKASWTWHPEGKGAVLLVNNDADRTEALPRPGQPSELGELIVRSTGLETLPFGLELRLYATPEAARRFAVFRADASGRLTKVLGKRLGEPDDAVVHISRPLRPGGERLFVEAHEYPGPFFEGLLTVELHLRAGRADTFVGPVLASDRVVFRVAPWIMLPNHLPAQEVHACHVERGADSNERFLQGLAAACREVGVPLTIVPPWENHGDRWIQDEVEIGYSQSPTHALHVAMDSPRDGALGGFVERRLLGPDVGHFQLGGSEPNSLDSFGNLEVSPPVTVNGRFYPFGRIVFGGRAYGDFGPKTRQMMPELRRFLYAQKVQSPIEIFTDWLDVGHADEIVCFVPDDRPKGFKVLLASPRRARKVLRDLSQSGHGDAVMFEGKRRADGSSAETTVDAMLGDADFWEGNDVFQEYMNLNRASLEKHLELSPSDVVEIPVLFKVARDEGGRLQRTVACFPDMVNHLVLGKVSVVPKPYGPTVDGQCAFEKAFRDALPDRQVRFIDDWYSYHELMGEVHCGTNVRRAPPLDVKWWEHLPDGGFDI